MVIVRIDRHFGKLKRTKKKQGELTGYQLTGLHCTLHGSCRRNFGGVLGMGGAGESTDHPRTKAMPMGVTLAPGAEACSPEVG